MSDDQTSPIEPEAPAPPHGVAAPSQPAYAMPLPAGYPAYAAAQPQPRPRFADQVMGMRAVVAVALACLIIGGLSGFILGHAAGNDPGGFGMRGTGFPQHGGAFPNGPGFGQGPGQGTAPNPQFGQGQSQGGR